MSSRRSWDSPTPLSRQRVCPSPRTKGGGGAHSPAGEGVGEFQFRRLKKKLSTLPTLCHGEGHTRLQERGWGSPNSDDWRKSLVVCLLCAMPYN